MMTESQTATIHHAKFSDIDQYAECVSGQDVRSYQLGAGALRIMLCEFVFSDLVIRRIQTNRMIEENIFMQPGWTTFSLAPGADIANGVWCGVQTFPNAIGVLRTGREHHTCIPGNWNALEIDVSDDLLINEDIVPEQLLDRAMAPEKGLLPLSVQAAYRLRCWLQSLFIDKHVLHHVGKNVVFASQLRRQILDVLADTLQEGLDATDQRPRRRPYRRYAILRQARSWIEECSWESLAIDSLADNLGVTVRTLQRTFMQHYQISPYQYLLRRRLNAARSQLQQSHRDIGSIADIASRYGFSNASQFAEHYKKVFDELPSATLNRQNKR